MVVNATGARRFAFGKNWLDYSATSLDERAYEAARGHLAQLIRQTGHAPREFLDIGCGSGLILCAAREVGFQRAVGFDYDAQSVAASERNLKLLRPGGIDAHVLQGDVLNEPFLRSLGQFDFVYAWGSLHHTGAMWQAIANAAERVAPHGLYVLAIYNRSRLGPMWRLIKRSYVAAPGAVQRMMVGGVYVLAALAKWLYTRRNPFKKERGMNFYHDIVDWVGGYPYEYAGIDEVTGYVEQLGFALLAVKRAGTPIACNEFVFRRVTSD